MDTSVLNLDLSVHAYITKKAAKTIMIHLHNFETGNSKF